MKPSKKSTSVVDNDVVQEVNQLEEEEEVEEVEDEEVEEEKPPAFVFARDMFELINTEMKASRLLSFVLQELLQYQDDVTEMVASCANVVEVSLEVVPPMKTFVELSIMKGLKQGDNPPPTYHLSIHPSILPTYSYLTLCLPTYVNIPTYLCLPIYA